MKPSRRNVLCALLLLALAGAVGRTFRSSARPGERDPYAAYAERPSVAMRGVFRWFARGHPDFGLAAREGAGRYTGIAGDTLDACGKPAFAGTGRRVVTPGTDAGGRVVLAGKAQVEARPGDATGAWSAADGRAVTGEATFAQWFRDQPGVNRAGSGRVTLEREARTRNYIFDGYLDHEGALASRAKAGAVARCTYEMETTFVSRRGAGWFVAFASDAECWMFVDGRLVLDAGAGLGGEGAGAYAGLVVSAGVELDRNASILAGPGTQASVVTDAAGAGAVSVGEGGQIVGEVLVGPGGSAGEAIRAAASASITGERGVLAAPVRIPAAPAAPEIARGASQLGGRESLLLEHDARCDSLVCGPRTLVSISGDRTVVCDGDFVVERDGELVILPDSSLQLFVRGAVMVRAGGVVNNSTRDAGTLTIYVMASGPVQIESSAGVYANVLAPDASLTLGTGSEFCGSFYGRSAALRSGATFTAVATGPWGYGSATAARGPAATEHRIDLDRLGWLDDAGTHTLKIFFADRDSFPSRVRLETNIRTLGLAPLPADPARGD